MDPDPQIRRLIFCSLEASAETAQATLHTLMGAGSAGGGGGGGGKRAGGGGGGGGDASSGMSLALPHAVEVLAQRMIQGACDACLKVWGGKCGLGWGVRRVKHTTLGPRKNKHSDAIMLRFS